jgi:hypothetical protein
MTEFIAGLPFWDVVFDVQGDPDTGTTEALLTETRNRNLTDLYVFTHGWNNDRATARRFYEGFFGLLGQQINENPDGRTVGLAGVYWPAKRWSDEPIPDFAPAPAVAGGGGGVAAATPLDREERIADPALDKETLADLLDTFPAAKAPIEQMAALLESEPSQASLAAFHASLKEFAQLTGTAENDGETGAAAAEPRMLSDDDSDDLFSRYRDALRDSGVVIPGGDGQAGLGDRLRGLLNGAKEALRQATYWEMKNRAGVVGRNGLGKLLERLPAGLRVHLIGHSFGARLVSYAIGAPQIKSVTLLQGAFSHFAFCQPLPFDAGRHGALGDQHKRVDGPVTVCFSSHDHAVGRFYPLASLAARDDTAGARGALWRWGGMGADGAQNLDAALDGIRTDVPRPAYRFAKNRILNVDCSDVVITGDSPSGAHSDVVHPEITWIVLAASRM